MEENDAKKKLDEFQKVEGKIDAIKEIIFGKDIADYNKQFGNIEDKFKQLYEDLKNKTSELETNFNDTIESLKKEHDKDISKLTEKLDKQLGNLNDKKADRKALGKMLQNIAEKLQAE